MSSDALNLSGLNRWFKAAGYREFERHGVGHVMGNLCGTKTAERILRVTPDPRWKSLARKHGVVLLPEEVRQICRTGCEGRNGEWIEYSPPDRFLSPIAGGEFVFDDLPLVPRSEVEAALQRVPDPIATTVPVARLEWEILPAEQFDVERVIASQTRVTNPTTTRRLEALHFLANLCPKAWAVGKYLGVRRYIVALFDRVAIADAYTKGNALYWTRGDWQSVFRLTKSEALAAGAQRIVHQGCWRRRIAKLL